MSVNGQTYRHMHGIIRSNSETGCGMELGTILAWGIIDMRILFTRL